MTYEETLQYLYNSIPVFQHSGASAYKPGLDTTLTLDNHLGNPHKSYKIIHIAGTNGKGSVSHLLAAILQQAGYKVGLYTSPHLVDFRERIRVNGEMIDRAYVTDFVERHRSFFEPLHPSFFELTSSMAFDYFRSKEVDYAVIETGLGGRLDSTNIITPILSIITNISLDHTQFLGDTIEKISGEKAGIIKPGVPALIGEVYADSVAAVFTKTASAQDAPLYFAQKMDVISETYPTFTGKWLFITTDYGEVLGQLGGMVQPNNARTVLAALHLLTHVYNMPISRKAVCQGFWEVVEITGLKGRWQTLQKQPVVVCDTGHNIGGWEYLSRQLQMEKERHPHLYMIVGMVNDKDIDGVLALMPKEASYFFTQASIARALPATEFAARARRHGLSGTVCERVEDAVWQALEQADADDLIFIGGSTFVVADALPLFPDTEEAD